jgi:hypothetical protein
MTTIANLVESSSPKSQSILKVDLNATQNFGATPIQKIVVPFKREEDMILLCLSNFLHDFVHDYNLSSMHKRVIKGDAYGVMKTLNIGIRNQTFKIFSYSTASYGDVELYDDSKFQDVPVDPKSKLNSYLNFIKENHLELPLQSGGDKDAPDAKPLLLGSETEDDALIDVNESDKFKLKSGIGLELEPVASGVEDILVYPIVSDFTSNETYNTLLDNFSKNADFLGFHSGLNTFIVSYLGSKIGEGKESPEFLEKLKPEMDVKSSEMNNLALYNYILCSIDCISADLKKGSLLESDISLEYSFFSDVFIVLRQAFVTIFNKTNNDLKTDSLTILNSFNVLQQFIIFYMLFLNCNNIDEFNAILQKQTGGQEGEEGESEGDEEQVQKYNVLEKTGPVEIRQYPGSEEPGAYYAPPDKKTFLGSESIFITHNNLLTTIARGMFIKLGLWDRLFAGVEGYSKADGTLYTFGTKEMDMISYDKLLELFPTNPWKKGALQGSFNNELLILQILILKNLLIEMSPAKTMTFGAKIDDQLKNYLDVFYNSYFIDKNQKTEEPVPKIDDDVLKNPDPNASIGPETESVFTGSEGHTSEDEQLGYSEEEDNALEGGAHEKEIEMVALKKPSLSSDDTMKVGLVDLKQPDKVGEEEPVLSEIKISTPNSFSETEIIDPGRGPGMPIVFRNLKKMYQNNIYTIQNLQSSKIPPLTLPFDGSTITINTLYDLMSYNQTLMHRTGSESVFNIPAPALKFVINNAANIAANINGSRMLYTKKDKDEIKKIVDEVNRISDFAEALLQVTEEYNSILSEMATMETREKQLKSLKRQNKITIKEYNELLKIQFDMKTIRNTRLIPCENKKYLIEKVIKLNNESLQKGALWLNNWSKNYERWFNQCQALFGLYRNLVRATFCPTVSMMDAMFNCSLKYGATEPKEVGTTHFELKYESVEGDRVISFGGVVLNYNENVAGTEQLNAKIDFDLACIDTKNGVNDVANISTIGMQVAESHDLKASVVYKCVVDKIKDIYLASFGVSTEEDVAPLDITSQETREKFLTDKINRMWTNMQIYKNQENFNKLLGSTAIKTFGDFLQECLACMKWGGYVNSTDQFPDKVKDFIREKSITPIYRSVSEPLKIVPYDEHGNAVRLGIQGDRPSGFRSIYILMNGDSGINQQSIGGYVYTSANQKPSRSILVSRNSEDETDLNVRKDGLRGKIIYVTRELPIIHEDKTRYLKSLQYKTIRERKEFIDKETKQPFIPEITDPTIEGTLEERGYVLTKPPTEISSLEEPYKTSNYNDWDDYEMPRVLTETKNKLHDFIESSDAEEKAKKVAEKAAEKARISSEKAAEKERMSAEAQGMKAEERRTKDVLLANKEIAEKQTLLAKTLNPTTPNPLDETEKRRLKLLQRKYASSGGKTKKGRKKTIRQKVSHKNKKIKNKRTKKHRSVKKHKRTKKI